MDELISGAVYLETATGSEFLLLGLKRRTVVLEDSSGCVFERPYYSFGAGFELTERHDHESFCCTVHGLHSSPHRGCVLR